MRIGILHTEGHRVDSGASGSYPYVAVVAVANLRAKRFSGRPVAMGQSWALRGNRLAESEFRKSLHPQSLLERRVYTRADRRRRLLSDWKVVYNGT